MNQAFSQTWKSATLKGFLAALMSLQTACSFMAPTTASQQPFSSAELPGSPVEAKEPDRLEQYLQALQNKKNNPPLPIEVDIIPGLKPEAKSVWHLFVPESGFSIKGLPQGPLVFQENFLKGKVPLEEIRPFRINDTAQRYTLHVQLQGDSHAQVSININGTDWIKASDFKGREAQIESLLLNANNTLRVRSNGKPGSAVQVSLVQAGEAGTVLKRRGYLHKVYTCGGMS